MTSSRRDLRASIVAGLLVACLGFGHGLPAAEPAAAGDVPPPAEPHVAAASDEPRLAAAGLGLPAGFAAELFAAEPLVANPVAFSIDEQGKVFVCEAFRIGKGVADNNSSRIPAARLDADIAARTVADRDAFLRRFLGDKAGEWQVESDRVRELVDADADGRADRSTVFATGFNRLVSGLGSGVLARRNDVLYACVPDLWRLRDTDGDGVADERTVLHTGYGVRVAFMGHDLHGLTPGPDGRIYFTMGDRGYHVEHEGRLLADPESGAVFRCEPDGSGLEAVHTGLRNPQELAFDDMGNLFTVDNNSDSGDRTRLVQVVSGGDSGWRMSLQYLPDRGPFNRERIWHLAHPGQPAWIVPPQGHIGAGPSGLAAYPGTGLTPHFDGRFLLADFRGAAAGSSVRTFRVRPRGAGFEACDEEETFRNLLATDVEVGPDGAVWVSDWVHGWVGEGKGRIWRFVPSGLSPEDRAARDRIVAEVRDLLAGDWAAIAEPRLVALLGHDDRRIRLEAQWELARRGAIAPLEAVARDAAAPLLARVHAIQGLAQIGRRRPATAGGGADIAATLVATLRDPAWQVRLVAARSLGESAGLAVAGEPLAALLADPHPHVRAAAALALARAASTGRPEAAPATAIERQIVAAVVREAAAAEGFDPHARHALVMALAATADAEARARLARHESASVRLVACLAMRRHGDAAIAERLADADPTVAVEAARAIHDVPIPAAWPALAGRLLEVPAADMSDADRDALLRRAVTACEREGTAAAADRLATFIGRTDAPPAPRLEAVDVLRRWDAPPSRDRVLGVWRPLADPRDRAVAAGALADRLQTILAALEAEGPDGEPVRQAVTEAAAALGIEAAGPLLAACCRDTARPPAARAAALATLAGLDATTARELAAALAGDPEPLVRQEARRLRARGADAAERGRLTNEIAALVAVPGAGPDAVRERQEAIDLLAGFEDADARAAIAALRRGLDAGTVDPRLAVEVREAAGDPVPVTVGARELLAGGDIERGREVFFRKAAVECLRCHRAEGRGGDVGPALDGIGGRRDRPYLLESVVAPSAAFADGFRTAVIVTDDGRTVAGIVKEETADGVALMTPDGRVQRIAAATIEERADGASAMPSDLATKLTPRELRDLVEWLASLTSPPPPAD